MEGPRSPVTTEPVVTTETPVSHLSGAEIAQPYEELARGLGKLGEGAEELAVPLAERAGVEAVTRDASGDIQVQRMPIFGLAGQAYEKAIKIGALAEADGDAKRNDIALRQQYRDNPDAYVTAANAYKASMVQKMTATAGPEVGVAVGRAIDSTTTLTYRGLLNEHEKLQLERADGAIKAGIDSARDDAMALARQNVPVNDPAMQQALGKFSTLLDQRAANPRLAYTKEQRDFDFQQFQGELAGQRNLYHVDQAYKQGGYQAGMDAAKDVLTNPAYKLSPQQREAFYHQATGEIHANEALRRQSISEVRAGFSELSMASALGVRIEPDQIDSLAKGAIAANDPGMAARIYASFARKPLNDDFGRQPFSDQIHQLNALKGAAQYGPTIEKSAQQYGLDPTMLTRQLYQENGLRPYGVSSAGARGIAQFMPETAARYGVNPDDPNSAIPGAAHYMADLKSMFGGNYGLALAGYNWGERHVAEWIASGANPAAMPAETRNYVRSITGQSISDWVAGKETPAAAAPGGTAASAWLLANRQSMLDRELWDQWTVVMKDYGEKGIRPNNDVVNDVIAGAHATGNAALLEQVAHDTARIDLAQSAAQQSLPMQHAAIAQLTAAGQAGGLAPGQAAVIKDLQARNAAVTKGLEDNPIATTVENFRDRFDQPAPLDLKDPDKLAAGLQQRARIAQFAQQNWQAGPVSAFDAADLAQVKGALNTADPQVKAAIFQGLSTLPPDVLGATLKKLGGDSPATMADAAAGSLMRTAPDIATSIFRGQAAIKADKKWDATAEPGGKQAFDADVEKTLPSTIFPQQARTDPTGPYATMVAMVKARYADLSAQANDTKYNPARVQQAVQDVTGGTVALNGRTVITPARGMTQGQFDGVMQGVTDNDMAGVTTLNGAAVSADYLRNNAQLENAGDGRYFVTLGRDPAKPVYAYRYANTEAPTKFVLDLRGRAPVKSAPDVMPGP